MNQTSRTDNKGHSPNNPPRQNKRDAKRRQNTVKNNEYEYFTYLTDGLGITDVYGWSRHETGKLVGHPRKMFLKCFQSLEAAKAAFPDAYNEHPAFE